MWPQNHKHCKHHMRARHPLHIRLSSRNNFIQMRHHLINRKRVHPRLRHRPSLDTLTPDEIRNQLRPGAWFVKPGGKSADRRQVRLNIAPCPILRQHIRYQSMQLSFIKLFPGWQGCTHKLFTCSGEANILAKCICAQRPAQSRGSALNRALRKLRPHTKQIHHPSQMLRWGALNWRHHLKRSSSHSHRRPSGLQALLP